MYRCVGAACCASRVHPCMHMHVKSEHWSRAHCVHVHLSAYAVQGMSYLAAHLLLYVRAARRGAVAVGTAAGCVLRYMDSFAAFQCLGNLIATPFFYVRLH